METGTGATITFSSGFFAKPTSINWSGITRKPIATAHMGTASWDTFVPGDRVDPGELEIEGMFDAETTFVTPIAGAAETITITLPSTGAGGTTTIAASGFMTEFEFTAADEEVQTFRARLKLTGSITVTP